MRHYALFRFYSNQKSVAVTAKERGELELLGEFQALRVIACENPDDLKPKLVWEHLEKQGLLTQPGTRIERGLLTGSHVTDSHSWDSIDTQDPAYRNWQPHPGHLIDNPCATITVEARSV